MILQQPHLRQLCQSSKTVAVIIRLLWSPLIASAKSKSIKITKGSWKQRRAILGTLGRSDSYQTTHTDAPEWPDHICHVLFQTLGASASSSVGPAGDLLHRTTAKTMEVLTTTGETTKAVLTAVSDHGWWKESLNYLRPLQVRHWLRMSQDVFLSNIILPFVYNKVFLMKVLIKQKQNCGAVMLAVNVQE